MKKFATLLAAIFIISLSPCASMLAHTAKTMEAMSMEMAMSKPHQGTLMDCCEHPQLKNTETAISIQQKTSDKGKTSLLASLIHNDHHSSLNSQLNSKRKPLSTKIMSMVRRE